MSYAALGISYVRDAKESKLPSNIPSSFTVDELHTTIKKKFDVHHVMINNVPCVQLSKVINNFVITYELHDGIYSLQN